MQRPNTRIATVALAAGTVLLLAAGGACGCIQARASLAADSLADRPGRLWPGQPQCVHVGESVLFDLRVKPAIDDYAVFEFPDAQVVVQANPVTEGYRLHHTFDKLTAGKGVIVKASAYRARGMQDLMTVNDRTVGLKFADDPRDDKLASASLRIIVYQARVELSGRLAPADARPDWSKTFLRIIADEGRRVSPDIPRAADAAGQGYRAAGPDPAGRFSVSYLPTAGQLSRGGATAAELRLVDLNGKTQLIRQTFLTP